MSTHAPVQKRQHEESAPQNVGPGKPSQAAGVGLPLFMQTNPTASAGVTLQRKCACGGTPGANDECATCNSGKPLQTKLAIGASDDPLEQEADRVADQVLAMSANSTVSAAPPRIQRYTGQATGETGTAPASVDRVLASTGRPLDATLQQDMGQRFGHDFSRVRVHSGAAAAQSARDVNANAYTVGHDMVFDAGRFAPKTHEGRRLIAHELTHVVQQSGGNGFSADQSNSKHSLSPTSIGMQIQRDRKYQQVGEIVVSAGGVRKLPKGVSPADFIARQVQNLIDVKQNFWKAFTDGITQFMNTMSFGEDAEVNLSLLNATFVGVLEGVIDTMIAAVPNRLLQGEFAAIKEAAFSVGGSQSEQQKGKGAAKIVTYVNALIDDADKGSKKDLEQMQKMVEALQKQYWTLDKENPQDGVPSPEAEVVVGPFASFLNDLERMVGAARTNTPSSRSFAQGFSERFAYTGDYSAPISRGGRPSGNLYLNIEVERGEEGWGLASIDPAWTLATNAPERGKLATSLKESLHEQGLSIIKTQLPKWVKLWVITEKEWALDRQDRGTITFDYDIDDYKVRNADSPIVEGAFRAYKLNIAAVNDVKAGD